MTTLADTIARLQRLPLDRVTKLQILDILATNPDPQAATDVATLLVAYEEMDARESEALRARLTAIDRDYQATLKKSAASLKRAARNEQDDIMKNDEIERIRQTLI